MRPGRRTAETAGFKLRVVSERGQRQRLGRSELHYPLQIYYTSCYEKEAGVMRKLVALISALILLGIASLAFAGGPQSERGSLDHPTHSQDSSLLSIF